MKIVIAGGSGFIGEPLVRRLLAKGHDVAVLSRDPAKVKAGRGLAWDGKSQGGWSAEAAAADVVINLAGENVGDGRWTDARKQRLIGSRLKSTRALIEALRRDPQHPRTYISASAVGLYGDRGDESLDEAATPGRGFLAELVEQWEAAAREAESLSRLVILRFGVVLAPDGGALAKLLLPFKLGAGGPIGSGKQWMSWVDRDDALRMMEWAIETDSARGVYNATAPHPATNRDFARALGAALHRPALLPTPGFALRLAFGEMADEMLLGGQRVLPARAQKEGFTFEYPTLERSLEHQLRP
jgi:uncharacterized protein